MNCYKGIKLRLYPNKQDEILLAKHFGCNRLVYNYFLNKKTEQYRNTSKSDNYYEQSKKLTLLKKEEDFKFLNEISAKSLQNSLRDLDTSFQRFFKKISNYPKYKSKRSKQSYRIGNNNDIRLEGHRLIIPKFKNGIYCRGYKKDCTNLDIVNVTIEKASSGKYYASLCIKHTPKKKSLTGKQVGIDLGLKTLVTTSDKENQIKEDLYRSPKYKFYISKLKSAHKHLSRKKISSHKYENQRLKLARNYEKITNCRTDMIHKLVNFLISKYDVICIEDLNTKGMMGNHKLARKIALASWNKLVRILSYKTGWYGRTISKVDRFYPSSKLCNHCGYINKELQLKDRIWTCHNCNSVLDRDYNASINILEEGLRLLANNS